MQRAILLKNKTAQQDKYEIEFQSNGFEPVFIPLISHTHIPQGLLKLLEDDAYLKDLQDIIVTSQRTVECLYESVLPQLHASTRQLFLEKTVYAVGPSTKDFLIRIGFKNVKGGEDAGNGSILSDIIISDYREQGKNSEPLLLVGEIRRDIIPKKLSSNGIQVKEVITYKTENLPDNLTRFQAMARENSWVVFFSPQGTEEIIESIKNGSNHRVASIGPTTEEFLQRKGLEPDVVSLKPDERNLVNAILSI
ncbi:ZYRO0A06138p [Zygosaccharomyces rouxii]|uniref:ZYRO0A06138p n=1 Tax=Zygosaccharomyces rouxii (strain ATCC 2623 / CBS 732 / NBRC 1130 / NCYC 568 / NRRL Y-229) TaxID=559307 RepID=C5DPU3_ZYGRC|nr:uncharacterized protein ZYRO0A06138g [Zygosaccharomyces rouxii]KAH9198775.1 tetrapyrrole biosynthesis, uroporphyrinogen III synthase [Zygosaccharomyces rouxii]CAR25704.1 ZYRO0A06138p [Zygosaccharomyces rouxii]